MFRKFRERVLFIRDLSQCFSGFGGIVFGRALLWIVIRGSR